MKKLSLLSLFIFLSIAAIAQLNENFDGACASGSFPSADSWSLYSPTAPANAPYGNWGCTANKGRPNSLSAPTPGMICTGTWGSAYHLDTSFLITPMIDLTLYTPGEHVYLNFDTKKDNIIVGGRLALDESTDSTFHTVNRILDTAAAGLITPVFGNPDSTNWVTHQADLSAYAGTTFFLAFRYTSTVDSGTAWYLDNVNITTIKLNVPHVNKEVLPLTVIGNGTSTQITLSYTFSKATSYHIVMYDMVGRRVYDGQLMVQSGTASYTINGLNLYPGMYCVKMGNENTYGTVKVIIQ